MNKTDIIGEIKRTAKANDGKPLGIARFEAETGISRRDWYGKYWARWKDALAEAGFSPIGLNTAYDDDWIIEQLVAFIQELGRYPSSGEIRLRSRSHPSFPSHSVFDRLGRKATLAAKIVAYCSAREGYDDVLEVCLPIADAPSVTDCPEVTSDVDDKENLGFVYLIKSGKHYKIGRSNSAGRRAYELSIQLPESITTVHTISTDDPPGIEAYWHSRFAPKRLKGEWFKLDAGDIRAFKRRKFM